MRRTTFAAAIATSAALVFMVQPMTARMLLPIVGGSSVVWSAALVFFQCSLLLGYAAAAIIARAPRQRWIFVGLLIAAGVTSLPFVAPNATPDWSAPAGWVLAQLAVLVMAPFVALSATSPLLQHWYAGTDEPDANEPYRFYAASNAGSILGLVAYPFVVEPMVGVATQAFAWALAYAGLVALVIASAVKIDEVEPPASKASRGPGSSQALWWVICAAIPSALLVTLTSSITADIAPVPLLWVAPLVAYLASHVWVFSRRAPDADRANTAMLIVAIPFTAGAYSGLAQPWWFFAVFSVLALFAVAVAYHGELARTRPAPQHLTTFYLWIAAGGALGGTFATFLAPLMFDINFELAIELLAAITALLLARQTQISRRTLGITTVVALVVGGIAAIPIDPATPAIFVATSSIIIIVLMRWKPPAALALLVVSSVLMFQRGDVVHRDRSAYGQYRVDKRVNELGDFHELVVGRVSHGTQSRAEQFRKLPLSYYHPSGPVGQVLRDPSLAGPIAVVGLGAGAAAAYSRDGRTVTFFELDPLVLEIAANPNYFSYLRDCGGGCFVEVGDGRILLEAQQQKYAVIILDAFSGDAIPTHLLTTEAFEMYRARLREGGAILVNGSNMYVDIDQVVTNAAAATSMKSVSQQYWPREAHLRSLFVAQSAWTLASANTALIDRFADDPRWSAPQTVSPNDAWTDDWQNLFAHYIWR